MSAGTGTRATPRSLRQAMSPLHIWAGILGGWLLYAMFLTGTISFFKDELSAWMRPELPAAIAPAAATPADAASSPDAAETARRVVRTLTAVAPGSPQWGITLPGERSAVASAFWRSGRRFERGFFDPMTGDRLAARETGGGEFFYRFHFQFHYLPVLWGRWLAGLCGMIMLVAIISGVITHRKIFVDFFTFRGGKGQRSWLDVHNAFSVLGLPFHLMITYTGLVTLMLLYLPLNAALGLATPADRQAMSRQTSAFIAPGKPSGRAAPLADVGDQVREGERRWGEHGVGTVYVNQPGDAAARVMLVRSDHQRVSVSPRYLLFDGATGTLLDAQDAVGPVAEVRGVMYALHLGRFAEPVTRWLYVLVSLAGTAMVGTGLVLWTAKRRVQPRRSRPGRVGLWIVERINVAAIAGLSSAVAAFLLANRLLPVGLAERGAREIDVFFIVWGAMLVFALLRRPPVAWRDLWWLAAGLFASLPLVGALTTARGLPAALGAGDGLMIGFDLAFVVCALLHAALARGAAWRAAAGRAPLAANAMRRTAQPAA
ncbi:MAG: PepSY-associated TM helix domain-containing protein [Lautropia sp.]